MLLTCENDSFASTCYNKPNFLRHTHIPNLPNSHWCKPFIKNWSKCQILLKIRPKEWATALVLKHLLVLWNLWTYCIRFNLHSPSTTHCTAISCISGYLRIQYCTTIWYAITYNISCVYQILWIQYYTIQYDVRTCVYDNKHNNEIIFGS